MQNLQPEESVSLKSKQSERVQAEYQRFSPGQKIFFVIASRLQISKSASTSQSMAKTYRKCDSALYPDLIPLLAGLGNRVRFAFSNPSPMTCAGHGRKFNRDKAEFE